MLGEYTFPQSFITFQQLKTAKQKKRTFCFYPFKDKYNMTPVIILMSEPL